MSGIKPMLSLPPTTTESPNRLLVMEVLLQTEAYSQPFSILCMELCIKDVNEATQEFLKKYQNCITFTNTPSWKFPHISIDKLDILPIIEKYRDKTFNERQQYQELLELLVDRVCFSLLTTCKLLGSTLLLDGNHETFANNETNSSKIHLGQGDFIPSMSTSMYKFNVRGTMNKSLMDPDPTTHPNVGLLLKQLFESVTTLAQTRTLEKGRKKNAKSKFSSTSAQTNDSGGIGCETCFVACNLLKFLATITTESLTTFTKTPSEIFLLRQEEGKSGNNVWNLSHREFLYEYCEAIQTDCKTLLEKASEVLAEKATIQKLHDDCKAAFDAQTKKNTNVSTDYNRKLKASTDAVEMEKRKHKELEKQGALHLSKVTELQSQLQKKREQVGELEDKVEQLTETIDKVNQQHKQLHKSSSSAEKARRNLEREVASLREKNNSVQKTLDSMDLLVGLKNEEIEELKNGLEISKREEVKKEEMKFLLEKAKKQLESCKKLEDERKRATIADKVRLERLKEEVAMQQEQIELLTLYPDLNGPINPPSDKEAQNPLQAMANQVRSNKLRIEVLQAQTDRLNATLAKCNVGFKSSKNRVHFEE